MREGDGPRRRWSGHAAMIAVLVVGFVVSGAIFDVQRRGENRYAEQLMDRYADEVSGAISERVTRYSETLTDLASAIGAQRDLRNEDFSQSSAGLDSARLPGASGIAFVVPATTAEIPAVQRHWRGQGATGLTLKPVSGVTDHLFIVFDRVFDTGTPIPGIDLSQSPEATKAMTLSRQISVLVISPTYQLIRDRALPADKRQTSILMAAPVHTSLGTDEPDRFAGWIVMGLRGQDFLSQTLIDRGQGTVQVSLTDPNAEGHVIAAVRPSTRVDDDQLIRDRALLAGQRRWQLTMWPTTRLLDSTGRGMSLLAGAAGVVLTIMLAVVIGVLAGSRNRAVQQVEQATAALRRDIERREAVEARLREREQQLHHLAFHDPLTGLANRKLFYERLTHAVDTCGERTVAVLFIDLDGFKQVNDDRGHHAGDTVLRTIAERLQGCIRTADTAARFGGDEFAVLLAMISDIDAAHRAAERIVADVQQPIDIAGIPAHVSASVGVALHRPGTTADDLLREADAAMYEAKAAGKNRYVLTDARA